MENILGLVGLFLAGVIAGAINSVAGGGSLISFPSLVAFGISPILANATNTAIVWPGTTSSAWAYRPDLPRKRELLLTLLIPSLLGGLLGAVVLVDTSEETFAHVVPFLILFATLLFAASDLFKRLARSNGDPNGTEQINWASGIWGFSFQLFVAAYGGYFGAGIGILMLASLSMMGLRDIHRMNALKTLLSVGINGIALIYFIVRGLIVWPLAILMGMGAIIGGYAGARLAKRVNQGWIKVFVVITGLFVSAWLFVKAI